MILDEINTQIGILSKADFSNLDWVGLIQSVEDLNRIKCLTLLQVRENSFELGHWVFWLLDLNGNICSSWVSCLQAFQTQIYIISSGSHIFRPKLELHPWLSWVLGFCLFPQIWGLVSFYCCMSQFLIINHFLYKCKPN